MAGEVIVLTRPALYGSKMGYIGTVEEVCCKDRVELLWRGGDPERTWLQESDFIAKWLLFPSRRVHAAAEATRVAKDVG